MISSVFGRRWGRRIIIYRISIFIFRRPVLVFQLAQSAFHSLNVIVELRRAIHVVIVGIYAIAMYRHTLHGLSIKPKGS
jgi:hypothetical protein